MSANQNRPIELDKWNRLYRKRLNYAMRKFNARTLSLDDLWTILNPPHVFKLGKTNARLRELAQDYGWLTNLSRALPPGEACNVIRKFGPQALDAVYRLFGWPGIADMLEAGL